MLFIPSSMKATAPRNCRNLEQIHPFCERMREVATTGKLVYLMAHSTVPSIVRWTPVGFAS